MIRGHFDSTKIDFIFFDKGGTLNTNQKHADDGVAKAKEIMDFLGYEGDPKEFRKLLKERDKKLKDWSFTNCYEETVEDMCKKWLFYDAPHFDRIEKNADKLVIMNAHAKGNRVMYPDAAPVVKELKKRGYRVGLISNTVSPTMLPAELKAVDILDDFEVVIMSAEVRIKKPNPEIFRIGCEKAEIAPEKCVYIGDQPNRDVEGPRKSGFAGVILLKTEAYDPEDKGHLRQPDAVVDTLTELLDIFPCRKKESIAGIS